MSLRKLILSAGLIYGLSGGLQSQTTVQAALINPLPPTITEHVEQLPRPTSEPIATYKLHAYKQRLEGKESKAQNAGLVEIRPTGIYAELLAGMYTLQYVQLNDSTYITQQKTGVLWFTNIETYTETKTDSVRLVNITANKEVKPQRAQFIGSAYCNEYLPLVELMNQFLQNTNPQLAQTVNMGESLQLPLYETKNGNTIITKANVGDILRQEGTVNVNLENPLVLYSTLRQGIKIPHYAEGKAVISNAPTIFSFLNGQWRITATKEE